MTDMESNQIEVIIAEDETFAREYLVELIDRHAELKLAAEADNGQDLHAMLGARKFDLAILDINLGGDLTALDVLRDRSPRPYVIFITAYRDFAVEAFELGAIDYLLKPYDAERFDRAIHRALLSLRERGSAPGAASPEQNENERAGPDGKQDYGLFLLEKGNFFLVPFREIIYLQSRKNRTIVYTEDRTFESTKYLREIEEKLQDPVFQRVHRQFIVNIQKIEKMEYMAGGSYLLTLRDSDNSQVPVGPKYSGDLIKFLEGT